MVKNGQEDRMTNDWCPEDYILEDINPPRNGELIIFFFWRANVFLKKNVKPLVLITDLVLLQHSLPQLL